MGSTFGRTVLPIVIGAPTHLLANQNGVQWKVGGVTLDWALITAVAGADVTLTDGTVVPIGYKALRYGQTLVQVTATGKWGPYDKDATDGRQTLVEGKWGLLDETWTEAALPVPGLPTRATNIVGVFDVGTVWYAKLLLSTTADPFGGPAGPTKAIFEAAAQGKIRYAIL